MRKEIERSLPPGGDPATENGLHRLRVKFREAAPPHFEGGSKDPDGAIKAGFPKVRFGSLDGIRTPMDLVRFVPETDVRAIFLPQNCPHRGVLYKEC